MKTQTNELMDRRSDCKILYVLYAKGAFDAYRAMTASEVVPIAEFKGTKVRKTLTEFVDLGHVGLGYRKCQARTFYITEGGIEFLKKVFPPEALESNILDSDEEYSEE